MTKTLKTIIFHTAATSVSTTLPRGDLEFGDWLRRALDCFNSRVIHQGTDYSCCDCPLLLSLRSHKCAVLSVRVFRARRVPSPCRVAGCLPFPVPPAVGSTCLCLFKVSARAARCRNLLTFRLFSRVCQKEYWTSKDFGCASFNFQFLLDFDFFCGREAKSDCTSRYFIL